MITAEITAGTLVPAVLMATSHSYGNGQTLTTHRIRTPQPITIKLCTIDYVHETNTQNLCQSAVRERLAKYVKYKASLFYFYFFPPNFDGFGEFDPLNVFGHRADPQKALPCVIARNLRPVSYTHLTLPTIYSV